MLIADLDRFALKNREQNPVVRMGNKGDECVSIQDVEEGEISDSASVEEISEEDFVKPPEAAAAAAAKVVVAAATGSDSKQQQQQPRVWTMRDLLKYQNKFQISRNYAPGLYNFAWAQAVQNKPLDDYLSTEFSNNSENNSNDGNLKRSSSSNDNTKDNDGGYVNSAAIGNEVSNKIVIDVSGDEDDDDNMVEKEEGELEEGEIDLEMEVVEGEDSKNNEKPEDNLDKEMRFIREGLEGVTVNEAKKSFDALCSRLQNLLDHLWKVVLENSVTKKDDLVQLSFSALQIVNTVFCSMSQNQKEQNGEVVARLLAHVMSQKPPLFSPDEIKEVEVMIPSNDCYALSSSTKESDSKGDKQIHERVNQNKTDALAENANEVLSSFKVSVLDAMPIDSSSQIEQHLLEAVKQGVSNTKSRVLLPLLDLHKDHDVDSLPSPTREMPSRLPLNKALFAGEGVIRPEWPAPQGALGTQTAAPRPYDTDALKAVSTYQQKFGRSSFLMSDRLPSPTPSEESGDAGGDIGGEVSSFPTTQNANSLIESTLARQAVSSVPQGDILMGLPLLNARNAGPVSSNSSCAMRVPTKSRDPRLRLVKSDAASLDLNQRTLPMLNNRPIVEPLAEILGSRKQKTFDEPVLVVGPAPKRQKHELTDSAILGDVQAVSQSGGWLEDRGTVGLQSLNKNHVLETTRSDSRALENAIMTSVTNSLMPNATNRSEYFPVPDVNATASIQSILKDIAVNPAMWMNIIKMEQQKSVEPTNHAVQSPSLNSVLTAVPAMTVAPPKPSVIGQRLAGILQTAQTASMDESGKIRMKPRDPRRALHINALQKGGNLASDQSNANISSLQGMKGNLKQEDQSDKNSVPSQPITPPDIARQFTKNLKNIADIMSVSQATVTPAVSLATVTPAVSRATMTPPVTLATVTPPVSRATVTPAVSQVPSSQPAQVHPSFVNIKGVPSDSAHPLSGASLTSEEVVASQPQNTWGDVEHLFDGYDDQQKAAIQRERARRMEEQKKMFSARKLCLVLDLDHTLLNSAKFVEIEPMHDEILRKKEEQDREKSQRHLFRFPHMGMWTKLRPGIWNFLEKASQLFELHLYTMGNKLYATEMAKVLDPKGVLFNGRVISRGDDGDIIDGDPKSKDLEGVLGMESAVVIIDDSIRVWPHNKLNLIVVERYIYFPCSRRQFGLPGPSLLEIDHDERPEDGTLASSLAVIERIHHNFFLQQSLDDADVRNILASEQRKILGGCRILFSRVFPVGEANPHLHPLWQTAEQFGAVCTNQIDEQVTHVVANSLGTDKVNWALSTGRFVVHPGWVEASALLYRRASEHDFAVKP